MGETQFHFGHALWEFVKISVGGGLIGFGFGFVSFLILKKTK